ncbi:MAG: helix-turn-helix transcriptional regulator [Sphaerochaetaceae bacterium]|nr:helix-turn-helix transcriptional regulator [Sphaerochaetaceae bacterium]
MMIREYQETYLIKAQSTLGTAFDFAINTCNIPGNDFIKLFLASSVSKKIERGDPAYIGGKSGIEIVLEIVGDTKNEIILGKPYENYGRSVEYWIGWVIAYYQWYSTRSFMDIFNVISFDDLQKIYYPLHEADISKVTDIIDSRIKNYYSETNLKRYRVLYGITQAELAKRSGVSLRSIQMYEQQNKNINKASADTLFAISRVLGITMEDLIEKG